MDYPHRSTGFDHRNICIEELAGTEAALRARVSSLEADVDAYRLLAQMALHKLADLTRQRDRHIEQYARLLAEARYLRGEIMRRDTARAAA